MIDGVYILIVAGVPIVAVGILIYICGATLARRKNHHSLGEFNTAFFIIFIVSLIGATFGAVVQESDILGIGLLGTVMSIFVIGLTIVVMAIRPKIRDGD